MASQYYIKNLPFEHVEIVVLFAELELLLEQEPVALKRLYARAGELSRRDEAPQRRFHDVVNIVFNDVDVVFAVAGGFVDVFVDVVVILFV